MQLGLHGVERTVNVGDEIAQADDRADQAADEQHGNHRSDVEGQIDRGEEHENQQARGDQSHRGEDDGGADPTGTPGDDHNLILLCRPFAHEQPCAIDGAPETIGHAEQEQTVGGDENDGTDRQLQGLEDRV